LVESSKRDLRKRILVADDIEDAASSLAMVCQLCGAQTRTAADGVEALRVGAEFRPQVVLLDITMPRMDGYEAARRIRAEPWGAGAILVALTGWGRQSDIDTALAAGFDGHLLKPVEADSMLRLIADLSERRNGGV
jgi:two-component system CheB/CheR fusion protein